MPIQTTFEENVLTVDFSNLTEEQIRLIKLAIGYQEEIIDEEGNVISNPLPWQLTLLQNRMKEIQMRVVELKQQEIAAQALLDAQSEINEVMGL